MIKHLQETPDMVLNYVPLNLVSVKLVLFTDDSFDNARGFKSRLGFVLVMGDGVGNANMVHYGSSRCHHVTRSELASEIHSLEHVFDILYVVKHLLEQLLNRKLELETYVDSISAFEVILNQVKTFQKRLLIDIHALREFYAAGRIFEIGMATWATKTRRPHVEGYGQVAVVAHRHNA